MDIRPPGCEAYERGSQIFCDKCKMTWDHDDDDPPDCCPADISKDCLDEMKKLLEKDK